MTTTNRKNPTPSQQMVAEAVQEHEITTKSGMKITLKKPGVLASFKLVKSLGPLAENVSYLKMVMPLLFVSAIDDELLIPPRSEREIDALILRLDDEGLTAAMVEIQRVWGELALEDNSEEIKK